MRHWLQKPSPDVVGCCRFFVCHRSSSTTFGWFSFACPWIGNEVPYCICWIVIHQLEQRSHQLQNPSQMVASLGWTFSFFVYNSLWDDAAGTYTNTLYTMIFSTSWNLSWGTVGVTSFTISKNVMKIHEITRRWQKSQCSESWPD